MQKKPKTNWHFVLWPTLGLWALGIAFYALQFDYQRDFDEMPAFYLFAYFIITTTVVLVINGIAGSLAHARYELAVFDESTKHCMDCNRVDGPLHVVDYHWYAFAIIRVFAFGDRGKFCTACAKVRLDKAFHRTLLWSCLCPPIVLWVWWHRRNFLMRTKQ